MQEKEHCTARKFSLNLQLLEAKTIFPNEVYFDFIKFKFNIILNNINIHFTNIQNSFELITIKNF